MLSRVVRSLSSQSDSAAVTSIAFAYVLGRVVVHDVNVFELWITFALVVGAEDGFEHICVRLVSFDVLDKAVNL